MSHAALQQKLHQALPDKIIGEVNECDVVANDVSCVALIDTGSMVSTMSHTFWQANMPPESLQCACTSVDWDKCENENEARPRASH